MDGFRVSPAAPVRAARRTGIPLGRLFGVPVRLSSSWLVLAALLTGAYGQVLDMGPQAPPAGGAYAIGFGFVVCLALSVLLHELGHALISLRYGIKVRGITLEMLGGFTEMEREPPRPVVELFVSLAGPLVSLLVGLAAAATAAALPEGTLAQGFAVRLAFSNVLVAAFNALPGLPLDGGRALQAAVWAISKDPLLGRRVAGWAGRLVAAATVVGVGVLYSQGRLGSPFAALLGGAFTVFVAITMWVGASQAIGSARLAARLPEADAGTIALPIVAVLAGTSLEQALQVTAQGKALVVVDPAGAITALVSPALVETVPAEFRHRVAVEEVSHPVDADHVLAAGLRGVDLMHAVRDDPAGDYLVVTGEDVSGVLRGAELFSPPESRRNIP
jgi:Zn-dependent protease